MKKFIAIAALAALCCTASDASAKKPKDQEFRHVVVTLASGEKVEGYVQRGWHAEASLFKKENFSFKITPTPENTEPIKYTAEEVESVEYTEKTEGDPDGIRWESRPLAVPGLSDRYRTMPRMVCCDARSDNAALYWWKTWEVTTNAMGQKRKLVTVYGIRFLDDPEGIVYSYALVNSVLLKDKKPGLKDFMKEWFKGPEGKERKRESKDDPSWMLQMYDDYLAAQAEQQ